MQHVGTIAPSNGLCTAVYVALMVLLVATVAAGYIDSGAWSFPVAIAIATTKAFLIILIFMRVRYGTALIGLIAGAGFFWLVLLFGLGLSDYFTR